MTEIACAHARLESEFFQIGNTPDAAVDMAYWCPDCGQDFEDDPTMVEAETRFFSNKALGLRPAAQVEADERFVFDAADLPF